MIGSILSAVGIPALIKVVKGALSLLSNEKARVAVYALEEVAQAISMKDITIEQLQEMNRHTEKLEEIEKELSIASIKSINETIQKEVASTDGFIRRWRALFGYAVACVWTLTMLLVIVAMFSRPSEAPQIINMAMETTPLWMIALAILGVSSIKSSPKNMFGKFIKGK